MKILYVAHHRPQASDGVTRKLLGQVQAWRRLGHSAELLVVSPEEVEPDLIPAEIGNLVRYAGAREAFVAMRMAAARATSEAWDAVYLRYTRPWPSMVRLARKLPLFVELNGSEPVIGRQGLPAILGAISTLPARTFLKSTSGVLAVSRQVADRLTDHGIPNEVVPNGVDLDRVPFNDTARPAGRLVFAGSGSFPWNGLDKLLPVLEAFPWLHLDIIGKDVAPPSLITHTRVTCHGPLVGANYYRVLQQATAGVGPLALHRRGLDDTSSLKLGEYLAAGLAVITGHSDPMMEWLEPKNMVLTLPNQPDGVANSIAEIGSFIQQWGNKRPPAVLRPQLSLDRFEAYRLEFIQSRMASIA